MSQPREYESASIEVALLHGDVLTRLRGHEPSGQWRMWELSPQTALVEYRQRCMMTRRKHPEMSPEQAEKVALLAWVKDMEAVASDQQETV